MNYFKALFIKREKLKQVFKEELKKRKKKWFIRYNIKKKEEILEVENNYLKLLRERDYEIKTLRRQHKKDLKAYDLYKEDKVFLEELMEEFEPLMEGVTKNILYTYKSYQKKKTGLLTSNSRTRKRDIKIRKLLGYKDRDVI